MTFTQILILLIGTNLLTVGAFLLGLNIGRKQTMPIVEPDKIDIFQSIQNSISSIMTKFDDMKYKPDKDDDDDKRTPLDL